MCPIQNEDYLMRQAQAVAAMLARILGLRLSGQTEEAKAELTDAYTALLGPQAELFKRLEAGAVAEALGSWERTLALATLCDEEAAQSGDAERGAQFRLRALELAVEGALRYGDSADSRRFLQVLSSELDREWLPPALQERAAAALRRLAGDGGRSAR
jgi:hypothetical protein